MQQDQDTSINWGPHEAEILSRYVGHNHKLEDTMAHMESTYGLKATIRQYKKRFSGYKNLKADEWIAVVEEVRNRAMRGIDSEVCLYGRPINRERIERAARRYRNTTRRQGSRRVVIGRSTQDRISIRTPRRRSPIPSPLWAASVPIIDASASFEGLLPDLDSGGGINVNMEDDFGDLTSMTGQVTLPLETFARIGEGPSGDVVGDIGLHNPSNIAVSPSAELLVLGGFCVDANYDWTMTINLPWFELRGLLEYQDLVPRTYSPREMSSPSLRYHPNFVSPDFHNRQGAVTDLAVTERHRLMGELLGYFPDGQVSDLVSSFASFLSPRVPERFEGELALRMQQYFEPSRKHPLRGLFELTAFFVSNNKLSKVQIENFLEWVIDQNHTLQLDSFLRTETATTRVFSQEILEAAVSIRNTEFLRSLLLSGVDFQHVIQKAIQINDSGFVELLLSRVNVECLSGDSGGHLLLTISHTDKVWVASILVENGANIDFNPNERSARTGTPLYHAVYNRNLEMVRFLLEKGANVNIYCYTYGVHTSIAAAVWLNPNTEIVTLLLKHGADINCLVFGQDLLEYVSLNCRNVYRLILEKTGRTGASVTVGDILDAARKGSHALSKYLARHQGRVSQNQLEKALYESIHWCDYDIKTTLVLLDSDIDPNGLALDEPPLLLAVTRDEEVAIRACQHLINAGASVNIPGLLCRVVEESKFDLLCMLLDAGADLNDFGPEALEKAVLGEEIEAIALLLDRGVEINAVGENLSPFQAAASLETLDLVQYLLDRDADVNTPAYEHAGRTALQAACLSGNLDMVTFLLANEADVNAAPAVSDGVTALEAVMSCRAEAAIKAKLFKLLLDNGAEVSHPSGRLSKGIIHAIVKEGLMDLLEIVLEAGADANQMSRGTEGRTPLQLAAELGRLDIAHALVAHGALINAPPAYRHGRTALQAAASSSSPDMELLKFLVDNGADVNAAAGVCGGITAVQGAAIAGSIPVVQYLLAKGANVNGRPAVKEGRAAIEAAAEHGRLDTVQLLLNYGAKGDVFQGKGLKRAIDLAQKNSHYEVAKMLISAQRVMESTPEGVAEVWR